MQFGDVIGYPVLNILNILIYIAPNRKDDCVVEEEYYSPSTQNNNPRNPEDLRPINLMPVVEKVIEITLHEQLSGHLRVNDVLFERQSGFRRNHSC
ncbi:unnamed protein product [Acanthoscelides obtectus]|uniref:Reverse transcriptase domain-containing protein n=1 Tax=Acanthoscelides obtectus TaxID=200917 RepID=A0A9P0PIS5_ACAOB|nr:unnamed protein product [Acanthoscelides obtectus]CAK1629572.1 hypothetical protein AOBTE_LOCUS5823 [Acanthoscelides obtectus]